MKNLYFMIVFIVAVYNTAISQIIVTFNGDTTKIWDKDFQMECCSEFKITSIISNDTIYITEVDTGKICDCMCNYTNCISFIALPVGQYQALLYRQIKYYGTPPSYAGSVSFNISSPPILSYKVNYYQSGCHTVSVNVAENPLLPQKYASLSNYPNPFNPGTTIRYSIPQTGHVTLTIFNLSGQQVAILIDEIKLAGTYELNYNTYALSSGVYICRLNYKGQMISNKLIILK